MDTRLTASYRISGDKELLSLLGQLFFLTVTLVNGFKIAVEGVGMANIQLRITFLDCPFNLVSVC